MTVSAMTTGPLVSRTVIDDASTVAPAPDATALPTADPVPVTAPAGASGS